MFHWILKKELHWIDKNIHNFSNITISEFIYSLTCIFCKKKSLKLSYLSFYIQEDLKVNEPPKSEDSCLISSPVRDKPLKFELWSLITPRNFTFRFLFTWDPFIVQKTFKDFGLDMVGVRRSELPTFGLTAPCAGTVVDGLRIGFLS